MATASLEKMQQDSLAMAVARALTAANEAALAQGVAPADSLVTITEEAAPTGRSWRVHYGPRDYIGRRGGDLIVLIDEQTATVSGIIHGQ